MAGHASPATAAARPRRPARPGGPDQPSWAAPILGVIVFLLFFVGTFLIVRGVDRDGVDPVHRVTVGSCVTKGEDSRLIEANCASDGAQKITQIAEAGRPCDDPADIQHIATIAGRPVICVRPGR